MSTFRPMTEADLPRVMDIIAQAQAYLAAQGIDQWQDGYPDEGVMREDIRLGQGYVLEEDGAVIGIASVAFGEEPSYAVIEDGAWTTEPPYGCIHRTAMDASVRGRGTASALIEGAENVVRARGVTSVHVDTHPENVSMQRLLQRHGYARCGVIHIVGSSEDGAERVALEKTLVP